MQLCFSVDASAEVRSPGGYSPAAVDFTEESKQGQQRGRRALELLMVGEVYGCCNVEAYIAVGRWLREGSTAGGEPPSPLARSLAAAAAAAALSPSAAGVNLIYQPRREHPETCVNATYQCQ